METANIGKSIPPEEKPKTVRLQPAVWKRLEEYQQQSGQASLEAAIASLLEIPSSEETSVNPTGEPRTLGIDPALGTLRWAVLERADSECELPPLLDYGTITTTPKCPTSQRLSELEQDLVVLLREFCPTEVAIEIPFLNTDSEINPKHLQNALEVIGVVDLVCYRECSIVPIRLYRNQWKCHVCDFRASDEDVTDTIAGLFDLQVKPSERLDAIAIAYAAICGVGEN
ncbi:crossover junction endodeoxyribonuclease RuvC [Gloeothece verrucosa]|nr:crossover junction endodeoxyribonuclease RuvC [Gloeothece verrucosa]